MKSFFCALLIGFSLVHSAARADDLPAITTAPATNHDYIGSGPLDDDRLHDFVKAREGENYTTSDHDDYVLLTSPDNTVFIYVTKPGTPAWPGLVQKRAFAKPNSLFFYQGWSGEKMDEFASWFVSIRHRDKAKHPDYNDFSNVAGPEGIEPKMDMALIKAWSAD